MHLRQQNQRPVVDNFSLIINKLSELHFDNRIFNIKKQQYGAFISQISNAKSGDSLVIILFNMVNLGFYPHSVILGQVIKKFGEFNQIEKAKAFYDIAV